MQKHDFLLLELQVLDDLRKFLVVLHKILAQEIRQDDRKSRLHAPQSLYDTKDIRRFSYLQSLQPCGHITITGTPAARRMSARDIRQIIQHHMIHIHQSDIRQCRCQFFTQFGFFLFPVLHGLGQIQKNADTAFLLFHILLDIEPIQSRISVPVNGTDIIARHIFAEIGKLRTASLAHRFTAAQERGITLFVYGQLKPCQPSVILRIKHDSEPPSLPSRF